MAEDIHWHTYAARFQTMPSLLQDHPHQADMVVCIPVYAEPDLICTLRSLLECELPAIPIEILLWFNRSKRMTPEEINRHALSWKETLQWVNQNKKSGLSFLPVYMDEMPDPTGGVGWARKLVMDEAARRLPQDGIILCLDADCTVAGNYLQAVYDYFSGHKACEAASIHFEHDLDLLSGWEREAIVQYELHLRYLVHAIRWTGHPFAFHTVGSAMAVRRKAYLAQGGMNTRQAGEDFYFLQKFIEVGTLHEIRNTTVYPSARSSGRVPFGTGRAMQQLVADKQDWKTTSLKVFTAVKPLFSNLDKLHQTARQSDLDKGDYTALFAMGVSPGLAGYLAGIDFIKECVGIASHTATPDSFRKRFFRYFNAFRMIRYSHAMRDAYYPDVPVAEAAYELVRELTSSPHPALNPEALLHFYRKADQTGQY